VTQFSDSGSELGRKETRQKIQDPRRKEARNEVTQFRDSGSENGGGGETVRLPRLIGAGCDKLCATPWLIRFY